MAGDVEELQMIRTDSGSMHSVCEAVFPHEGRLGLTITRQVIKQHGGTLEVDSTPGQGTTFTIRIPLASEVGLDDGEQSALEQAANADVGPDENDAHP